MIKRNEICFLLRRNDTFPHIQLHYELVDLGVSNHEQSLQIELKSVVVLTISAGKSNSYCVKDNV